MAEKKKGLTYAEAGVDFDAGEREVELSRDPYRRPIPVASWGILADSADSSA